VDSSEFALRGNNRRDVKMMQLNDDAFARMVAEEVKNKLSPLHKQELMRQDNWERWKSALLALAENLQDQIVGIEQDAESDSRRYAALGRPGNRLSRETDKYYDSKATRVKRFKFHVDKRLDEVCAMIETGSQIKTDGWDQVDFLRRGIIAHRTMMRDFDLEETALDRALWATLDNKWEFDSISSENVI